MKMNILSKRNELHSNCLQNEFNLFKDELTLMLNVVESVPCKMDFFEKNTLLKAAFRS